MASEGKWKAKLIKPIQPESRGKWFLLNIEDKIKEINISSNEPALQFLYPKNRNPVSKIISREPIPVQKAHPPHRTIKYTESYDSERVSWRSFHPSFECEGGHYGACVLATALNVFVVQQGVDQSVLILMPGAPGTAISGFTVLSIFCALPSPFRSLPILRFFLVFITGIIDSQLISRSRL